MPERSTRTVLVAGGTGFVGSACVRALRDRGHRVVVLSRSPSKVGGRFPGREVEARGGDVTRPDTLPAALEGVDTVVQAVQFPGFPVENPARGRTFREVDARGTANVAAAAADADVEHLVYLSGAGMDSASDRPWFRAKAMAERSVREGPFRHTVVRPSVVYGPEDRSLNLVARAVRWVPGVFPQLGDGSQRLNPVHVEDVAGAVARRIDGEGPDDALFGIGGPVTYTMDGVVRVVMDVLERRKPIVHVPFALARAGGAVAELLPGRPFSRGAAEFLVHEAVADLARFREIFPEFDLTGLQEGLEGHLARKAG